MNDLFNKLAAEENAFIGAEVFAPVLMGQPICVKIARIVLHLNVKTASSLWGVFKVLNYKEAKFIRAPSLKEKQEYFKLFPALRLILCGRDDNNWYGIPAHAADTRFKIIGSIPVLLPEEVQMFDTVIVRFDGKIVWFEQIDPRHNLKAASYLRESLNTLVKPDKLSLSGLTQEEKNAYLMAYGPAVEADIASRMSKEEMRLRGALERAGAAYTSHVERDHTYTIEYTVDGQSHRSVIRKDDLQVESAGICLSGGDKNFDLQSLVGVLREGERHGRNNPVALNRDYGYGYVPHGDEDSEERRIAEENERYRNNDDDYD
jgi:hypothetical protein